MTTLAADTPRDYGLGEFSDYPVIAADIIYEGAAVGDNGAGYARPLVAGDRFLGFCTQNVDNSTGAAGAKYVRVRKVGTVQLSVSGAVITDIGQPVFASDDNAFVFTPTGNSFIGKVTRFVSSGVAVVAFDTQRAINPYDGKTIETLAAGTKTLDAQDSGKLFWCTYDGIVVTLPAVEGMAGFVFVNGAADGTVAVNISPNSSDMIEGPDISGQDDKDIINTKTTANRGDLIELRYGDTNGWTIVRTVGTWAREG